MCIGWWLICHGTCVRSEKSLLESALSCHSECQGSNSDLQSWQQAPFTYQSIPSAQREPIKKKHLNILLLNIYSLPTNVLLIAFRAKVRVLRNEGIIHLNEWKSSHGHEWEYDSSCDKGLIWKGYKSENSVMNVRFIFLVWKNLLPPFPMCLWWN